jgi:hypothetical protein
MDCYSEHFERCAAKFIPNSGTLECSLSDFFQQAIVLFRLRMSRGNRGLACVDCCSSALRALDLLFALTRRTIRALERLLVTNISKHGVFVRREFAPVGKLRDAECSRAWLERTVRPAGKGLLRGPQVNLRGVSGSESAALSRSGVERAVFTRLGVAPESSFGSRNMWPAFSGTARSI